MAGLVVGLVLIPQGMAYAYIAGLPPVYGLYTALLPTITYALMGTGRQLAVGPVAMDSLLVAAGLSTLAVEKTNEYILLAVLLAMLTGLLQLLFGVLRLGFLVNFLSRPVISGFTSAAAFIIGFSQLKNLTGANLTKSNTIQSILYQIWIHIHEVHWPTLWIGLGGIGVIILFKRYKKQVKSIPGALVVVILGTLVVFTFHLEQYGVGIIREVPRGLPSFAFPVMTWTRVKDLFPMALTLSLIAFMEVISLGKAMQAKHKGYALDANQELIALGTANLLGSCFQAFSAAASFSRTAVNSQAGAQTGIASLISSTVIALTLLYLTPLFYYLPKAVFASIIMVSVFGLVNYKYPVFLWKTKREEFWMLLVTFIVTLTVRIQEGILLGVVLSLIWIIYQTTRPHVAELGYLEGTGEYRNVNRFEKVIERKDILIFRYDASLYFVNVNHFRDTVEELAEKKGDMLKLIILNAESISSIDSSAMEMLRNMVAELKKQEIEFYVARAKGPVRDTLHRSQLKGTIGDNNFFLDMQDAVDFYDGKEVELDREYKAYATQANVR